MGRVDVTQLPDVVVQGVGRCKHTVGVLSCQEAGHVNVMRHAIVEEPSRNTEKLDPAIRAQSNLGMGWSRDVI